VRKLNRLAAATAGLCLGMMVIAPGALAAVTGSVTPNTSLTDGATVHVQASGLPANLAAAGVAECTRAATGPADCEGATQNVSHGTDASGNYDNTTYKVRTLPDVLVPAPAILCDGSGSNECSLFVGVDLNDWTQPHTLLPIEFASPTQGVPEVPYAVLLPLSILGVVGVGYVLHRRRNNSMPAA